jgi:hypothetical protein
MSLSSSKPIQRFLERSVTVQSTQFCLYNFKASSFEPIAAGVKSSQSLQKIVVSRCRFDSESTKFLQSIFQCPESTVQSLEISGTTGFEISLSSILSDIVSVKPKTSKLTKINLAGDVASSQLDLATLLRPLEDDSTLEHLNLGLLESPKRIQELLSSIPRLRGLKEITFTIRRFSNKRMQLIIQAIRQNWSLEKVNCSIFLRDASALTKMQLCLARNKSIHDWTELHTAIPTSYWPRVFASALDYEYRRNIIFMGLIALGDRVGVHRSLKRSPRRSERLTLKSQTKR